MNDVIKTRNGRLMMTRKPAPAVFHHPKFVEFLKTLQENSDLRKMVRDMEDVLLENTFAGERVKKSLTPKYYVEEYDLNPRSPVLYVYDHPRYYRSCYTVGPFEDLGVCPIILDIMDHNEYNRKFGFRKK